jgi:hypothetical protein
VHEDCEPASPHAAGPEQPLPLPPAVPASQTHPPPVTVAQAYSVCVAAPVHAVPPEQVVAAPFQEQPESVVVQ